MPARNILQKEERPTSRRAKNIMKRKRILYAIVVSALSLTLLAGCGPKEQPAETKSPSPTPDTGYVTVPEMDEDLIAQDEEKEITVHRSEERRVGKEC